jgi:hypothetical protein
MKGASVHLDPSLSAGVRSVHWRIKGLLRAQHGHSESGQDISAVGAASSLLHTVRELKGQLGIPSINSFR